AVGFTITFTPLASVHSVVPYSAFCAVFFTGEPSRVVPSGTQGPSDKAGIKAGDRIIEINDTLVAGLP
ncbi:PDZ domain-containing protein, partial [Alistipes onderdonkii]